MDSNMFKGQEFSLNFYFLVLLYVHFNRKVVLIETEHSYSYMSTSHLLSNDS